MSTKPKQWSAAEQTQLFALHLKHRNKWSLIAKELPSKDYNSIKNKFYSTLRKGLRKINKYITSIRKKSHPQQSKTVKILQDLFVVKLIAVADDHFDEKYEVKPRAVDLAPSIQARMIEIACSQEEYQQTNAEGYQKEEILLTDIQEFNKNCKRRKGKKKTEEERADSSPPSNHSLLESEIIEDELPQHIQINVIDTEFKLQSQAMPKTMEDISASQHVGRNNQKLIFSGFQDTLGKKEDRPYGNFASLAAIRTEGFTQNFLAQDYSTQQNMGKLSQSGNWVYESSTTTRQVSKKMSNYMTEPSPHPTDPYSPYTFNNLMKQKNITPSNMFDDRSSCADFLESQRIISSNNNNKDEKIISFVEHIPMFQPELASFLVRSADMRKQYENARDQHAEKKEYLTNSLKMEKKSSQMAYQIRKYEDNRSFAQEYAFTDNTAKITESPPMNNPPPSQP